MSNDNLASTSVDTRPGIISRIFKPKETAKRSKAKETTSAADAAAPKVARAAFKVSSTIAWYCGICDAAVISDGLVVASRGVNFSIASISPVSATTTVIAFSCSSKFCAMNGTFMVILKN